MSTAYSLARLGCGFAVLLGMLLAAPPARGNLIYHDLGGAPVQGPVDLYYDLNQDGSPDVALATYWFVATGVNCYTHWLWGTVAAEHLYSAEHLALGLPEGAVIGPGLTWTHSTGPYGSPGVTAWMYLPWTADTRFPNSGSAFVPVRVEAPAPGSGSGYEYHYGWLHFELGAGIRLRGWAYETTPDQAVVTQVFAPTPATLLAMMVPGVAVLARRRRAAPAGARTRARHQAEESRR